jgi:hypothetical protein
MYEYYIVYIYNTNNNIPVIEIIVAFNSNTMNPKNISNVQIPVAAGEFFALL